MDVIAYFFNIILLPVNNPCILVQEKTPRIKYLGQGFGEAVKESNYTPISIWGTLYT
jgi:hypothetical protein